MSAGAEYWSRIYNHSVRGNSIWRRLSPLVSGAPSSPTTPTTASSRSKLSSSLKSTTGNKSPSNKTAFYIAMLGICIQLIYIFFDQIRSGLINNSNNDNILDAINSLSLQQSKGIYNCHPPMEQLLVGKIDISQSSAFESVSKWADDTLNDILSKQGVDSISFSAFGPSGNPVYERRIGNRKVDNDSPSPVNKDTIYRVASITKVFTVLELLHLRDEGLLDFDADITRYLGNEFEYPTQSWRERLGFQEVPYNPATELNPDSNSINKNHEKITVRQLISHLSGLLRDVTVDQPWPILNGGKANFEIPNSRRDVFDAIKNNPTSHAPSSSPKYSNLGFQLAEYIIEEVYRQSPSEISRFDSTENIRFDKIIQKNILEPLNMKSTFFDIPQDKKHLVADPCPRWIDKDLTSANGAFGLSTTIDDLRRFSQAILSNYHGNGKGPLPISSATIREWFRPTYTFDDSLTALGAPWEILNYPPPVQSDDPTVSGRWIQVYTKGGLVPGYLSFMILDPARQFGINFAISGSTSIHDPSLFIQQISTRFGAAFSEYRKQILSPSEGTYCLLQDPNTNHTKINPGSPIAASNKFEIKADQDSLYIAEWTYWGIDMLKSLQLDVYTHLNNKPRVALWPSTERGIYRAGVGRPPLNHFEGCSKQFSNLGTVTSNGFPMDLISVNDEQVYLPGGNLIYSKKNC